MRRPKVIFVHYVCLHRRNTRDGKTLSTKAYTVEFGYCNCVVNLPSLFMRLNELCVYAKVQIPLIFLLDGRTWSRVKNVYCVLPSSIHSSTQKMKTCFLAFVFLDEQIWPCLHLQTVVIGELYEVHVELYFLVLSQRLRQQSFLYCCRLL
ncbi:unnamed protein product [Clavelina lepadiformis]|uniref:Uncharacterized protein n=1 Tax=Clavelina lepadiformis TaxID=159417 RepID=A0ABP0GIF8_CLALP